MSSTPRTVWFHRAYEGLTGGHVKHAHYVEHVRGIPGFRAKITFVADSAEAKASAALARQRDELWRAKAHELAPDWAPMANDILFVAGTDWRYLATRRLKAAEFPVLNFVQHVRHAHVGSELRGYLANRAIRICVSQEVADAILADRRTNGPVVTIPNGIDVPPPAPAAGEVPRRHKILIVGYKRPQLAEEISQRLSAAGLPHLSNTGFLDRTAFLALLGETEVAVCLPHREEGFYLPALEAMAKGCVVVTLDCVGNRGFCRHSENCLIAESTAASVAGAVRDATRLSPARRERLLRAAAETTARHSLTVERERFGQVLANVDRIWAERGTRAFALPSRAGVEEGAKTRKPLVDFMIVGAQKCGNTALASFLGQHPKIRICGREMHVFDDPDYRADWTVAETDERYRRELDDAAEHEPETLCGEYTPIYMYLPEVAGRLKDYNPNLKLIVLLRDPTERAISHYHMEQSRGHEKLPLALALLLESSRLARDRNPTAPNSPTRLHSYRARGKYRAQLRNLFRHFQPDNILIVRNHDLRERHDATLRRVFEFLGVCPAVTVPPQVVFAGRYAKRHPVTRTILKLLFLRETRLLRQLGG